MFVDVFEIKFLMIRTNTGGNKTAIVCYSLMAILSGLAIAHSDTTLYSEGIRRCYLYFMFLCLVIGWIGLLKSKVNVTWVILVPVIYYSIITLHTNMGIAVGKVFDAFYSSLRLVGFLLLVSWAQIRVFKFFRLFLIVIAGLGIVIFISNIVDIPLPHSTVEYYTDSAFASYIDYKVGFLFLELGAVRLCGLFNEPGLFGTLIVLVLCADNYNLRKSSNAILFIAACCTFSIAFLIITIMHFIIRCYRKPKIMVPLLIIVAIILFILPNISSNNPVAAAFLSRLEMDDGSFVADNRSTNFIDETLSSVLHSSKVLWGYGGGYFSSIGYESGASTYKTALIDFGVLGFFLIYGLLILSAFRKAKGNPLAVNLVMCFAMSIYQRPNVFTLVCFVVLFGGIQYIKHNRQANI